MSQLKIKDGNNWIDIPAGGIGVPSGGTTGQVLQKSSNTDYATEWATPPQIPQIKGGLTTPSAATASGYRDTAVTFDSPFSGVPEVVVSFDQDAGTANFGDCAVGVLTGSVTATGFTIRFWNNTSTNRTPNFRWIAFYQG